MKWKYATVTNQKSPYNCIIVLFQRNGRFKAVPINIPAGIFLGVDRLILKLPGTAKRQNSQGNLTEQSQSGRTYTPDNKAHEITVTQGVWADNRLMRQKGALKQTRVSSVWYMTGRPKVPPLQWSTAGTLGDVTQENTANLTLDTKVKSRWVITPQCEKQASF